MNRITLLALASPVASIASARLTDDAWARSIGVVAPGFGADSEEAQAVRDGPRAAGYVEGRDLVIDSWYGHGSYDGVNAAVTKVVHSKVDVLVVESPISRGHVGHRLIHSRSAEP